MPKTATVAKSKVSKVATKKVTVKKVAIKKAVIKKAVKSTVKKAATKKTAKSVVVAGNDQSFWLADGQILNSLVALRQALKKMEQEVFAHHVAKEKNDFADWVDLVLADADCAVALRKVKTPKAAHTVVARHLKVYKI